MRKVKLKDEECKTLFTLNTWTLENKREFDKLINQGYAIRFASSCIGHTLAEMVEDNGITWAKLEYGDRIEVVERDGYGDRYCIIAGLK